MKTLLRYFLILSMMLSCLTANAIVRRDNKITYSSEDEQISAQAAFFNLEGKEVSCNIKVSFGLYFLFDRPFLFTYTIHRVPGTNPFPDWLNKLARDEGSGIMCFFFNNDLEEHNILRADIVKEYTDATQITFGCAFMDDDTLLKALLEKKLWRLTILGPEYYSKGNNNDKEIYSTGEFSEQPQDIFFKIWQTEHQDYEREEVQKQQNQQQSQSQQQQNRQQQQSAPQSTSPYGDLVFHGYTYEWNDFHQHASERDNGKLTLQTTASHYIGVMFNSHVTNISPDRKSSTIWSTRNGAIKVPLPKGVSINKTDEVIVWENTGSNGSKSTVAFAFNPSTQTLQVIYHCKRQWQGKTLNDRFYFRTRDAAVWQQIKSRLMQELPYCGNRIN